MKFVLTFIGVQVAAIAVSAVVALLVYPLVLLLLYMQGQ
jgi:hypothetical protein